MTNASVNPTFFLQGLIAKRSLASRVEALRNEIRTKGWYPEILSKQGQEAADTALAEWEKDRRLTDFAGVIAPVARGMLALAEADKEGKYSYVVDVHRNGESRFPRLHNVTGSSKMVVVFNRTAAGCGCHAPTGSADWAPLGRLGLAALTLEAAQSYDGHNAAKLGLVFPERPRAGKTITEGSFVVATMTLEGMTDGHTHSPGGVSKDSYLMYSLGLITLEQAFWQLKSSGGHFDDAVGFPGATDYLANRLPHLPTYLTELAAALTKHAHE